MDLYEKELLGLGQRLAAKGVDIADFVFDRDYLPPESEDGAMFTLYYTVTASRRGSDRTFSSIGGIGRDWAVEFEHALETDFFDAT